MTIGAIIVTSLSYASQMQVAEYVCNAERFDKQSWHLCWFDHGDHSAYANGKQDSMPKKMDRNQWTNVWEHHQVISWCCDLEVEVR